MHKQHICVSNIKTYFYVNVLTLALLFVNNLITLGKHQLIGAI